MSWRWSKIPWRPVPPHWDSETRDALHVSYERALDLPREAEEHQQHTGQADFVWVRHRARIAFRTFVGPRVAKIDRAKVRRRHRLLYLKCCQRIPPPSDPEPWDAPGGWPRDPNEPGWDITWRHLDPGYSLRPEDDEPSPVYIPSELPLLNYFQYRIY
ncbi:hypothetical protein B0H13DRAFT_2367690 [Mycena leptocephala]|nr:hypothetical protein B0H13DRAFT_2367690 [Mycena leptocephala]